MGCELGVQLSRDPVLRGKISFAYADGERYVNRVI